jgi:hypothetical protein
VGPVNERQGYLYLKPVLFGYPCLLKEIVENLKAVLAPVLSAAGEKVLFEGLRAGCL